MTARTLPTGAASITVPVRHVDQHDTTTAPGLPAVPPGGTQEAAGGRLPTGERSGAGAGLVICAKTGHGTDTDLSGLVTLRFPSADLVDQAAGLLPARDRWDGHEGPRPRITIAPGCITVSRPDLARRERTAERASERHRKDVDRLAAHLAEHGSLPDDTTDPTREITGWSRKSRSNFVHRLCSLDYAPMFTHPGRLAAMVTLTYPGDWLTVAPNGKSAHGHLKAFRKRYERAWDEPLCAVWKLEFQRRGAPHFHLLIVPPHGRAGQARRAAATRYRPAVGDGLTFREWLSATWADIVAHPDPAERARHTNAGTGVDFAEGLRATDPRRVAVYFLKHGGASAKEYQHIVPEPWRAPGQGPGRFWGYWHLQTVTAGREVDPATATLAVRVLRRWAAAQGVTRQVRVPRVDTTTGRVRLRTVRRPVRRLGMGAGWVAVNDGAGFGSTLARYLSSVHTGASIVDSPQGTPPTAPGRPDPVTGSIACSVLIFIWLVFSQVRGGFRALSTVDWCPNCAHPGTGSAPSAGSAGPGTGPDRHHRRPGSRHHHRTGPGGRGPGRRGAPRGPLGRCPRRALTAVNQLADAHRGVNRG